MVANSCAPHRADRGPTAMPLFPKIGTLANPESKYHISDNFYKKIFDNYLQTTDVKKIDAGGGMIHGEAKDFVDDKSRKIIFSSNERAC